jgi:hypothetical protein
MQRSKTIQLPSGDHCAWSSSAAVAEWETFLTPLPSGFAT